MGEDICKPCEHYFNLEEENLSHLKNQNDVIITKKEEKQEDIPKSTKLLLNSIKKVSHAIDNQNQLTSNNDNMKSSLYRTTFSKNEEASFSPKVVIDQKDLDKVILKYNISLIIWAFRKFKQMKEEAHTMIEIRNNLREKGNLLMVEGDEDLDVDLFPEEEYNYMGNMFNNKKDGFGIQYFPRSNSIYVGTFLNDKRINYCKFEDKSKQYTYQGEINNNFTGKYGQYFNYDKKINYVGEWVNNRKEGIGIEKYNDGSFYQGEFKNGVKSGIGSYIWMDGSKYEGGWKFNLLEGYGIYQFSDGSICSGFWYSNQINGFGKFTFPDIKCYLGFFENDIKCGFGLIFWFKERKAFIGYWKDNKQNGLGKFIHKDKIRYGYWENGTKKLKYDEKEFFRHLYKQKTVQFYKDIFSMNFDELNDFVKNYEDF